MLSKSVKLRAILSRLALAIGALALAGHAALGVTYVQEWHRQNVLTAEIKSAADSLAERGDTPRGEEGRSAAEAKLEAEKAAFPLRLSGSHVVGALLGLAEDNSIVVSSIKTRPGATKQVGDNKYRSLSVDLQLEGGLESLRALIGSVEEGALQTATVDSVRISRIEHRPGASPGLPVDGSRIRGIEYTVAANLALSVYARY